MTSSEGLRQPRFSLPPGATRVLLVRHGESEPALPDRPFPLVDGHGDPALHPEGRAQAVRLGERLGEIDLAAIYVTTLRRTHQTAAPLVEATGIDPRVESDLREVHLGDWEGGLLRLRAAESHPTYVEVTQQQRWDVIPGAEPLDEFDRRTHAGLQRIAGAHPDSTVVAVCHGGVINQLLCRATGALGFTFAGAANGSISELVVDGRHHVLRRFNDTAHLE